MPQLSHDDPSCPSLSRLPRSAQLDWLWPGTNLLSFQRTFLSPYTYFQMQGPQSLPHNLRRWARYAILMEAGQFALFSILNTPCFEPCQTLNSQFPQRSCRCQDFHRDLQLIQSHSTRVRTALSPCNSLHSSTLR